MYRGALMEVNPVACDDADNIVFLMGEKWVVDDRPVDLDKLMTAAEIADRFGFKEHNIRDWARRNPDKITKHRQGHKVLFHLREVLKYHARSV